MNNFRNNLKVTTIKIKKLIYEILQKANEFILVHQSDLKKK